MGNNMKAEINKENKARFYGANWGNTVVIDGSRLDLNSIDYDGWLEDSYLELKPLSDISDEDAIEVYCRNLVAFPKDKAYLETKSFSNNILGIKISCLKYPYLKTEYFDINYIDIFRAEFLRSREYLLPWMGLSCEELIEASWAKYKE